MMSTFQCSSASRKFLNSDERHNEIRVAFRFSALQRAENSSILPDAMRINQRYRFSALQRAENSSMLRSPSATLLLTSFSALQRAENSSIAMKVCFP